MRVFKIPVNIKEKNFEDLIRSSKYAKNQLRLGQVYLVKEDQQYPYDVCYIMGLIIGWDSKYVTAVFSNHIVNEYDLENKIKKEYYIVEMEYHQSSMIEKPSELSFKLKEKNYGNCA